MTVSDDASFGPPARKKFAVSSQPADDSCRAVELASEFLEWMDHANVPAQLPCQALLRKKKTIPDDSVVDLQLATCRRLRELLPTQKDLLVVAQERNWIPVMLSWLNLHDRPAVQVEALLALTHIAELCAQQSYLTQAQQTSAVAAAAQAAVSSVKGGSTASFQDALDAANKFSQQPLAGVGAGGNSKYPYPSLVTPAPGSVPFPPLSFSQTLSPEAVAAFDASLASTVQLTSTGSPTTMGAPPLGDSSTTVTPRSSDKTSSSAKWNIPPAPLFPSPALGALSSGINFTSLAPPPGGAHSSVPSNAFLPPPTPVAIQGPSFPQQLSASSQHLLLRHADAIPTLISLLSSSNREVYEQAMWILGSIAAGDAPSSASSLEGKSVSARDVILAAGVMNQLLRCLESHPQNLSLQRIGSWTLSNLVDGIFQQSHKNAAAAASSISVGGVTGGGAGPNGKQPAASSEYSSADEIDMPTLLPVLRRLLRMTDSEVLSYTCWTLSHLCDGPSSHIAAVVTADQASAGLVPRLVELLMHPSWRVTKPALRTIGNIVCAECSDDHNNSSSSTTGAGGTGSSTTSTSTTTDYTEVILECDAVPRLKELVTHSNREIQKEACWTLSNIAAGTVDQIQAVIDSGAIPPLVQLVRDKRTDQEVRSEACWVVLNATSCGSDAQIEVLVDEGCVAVLGVLLNEASMVMMALEGLERVLQVEETRELMRQGNPNADEERAPMLVSASLIETARESHHSSAVTKRADRIWKQHFVQCALCQQSFSKHRAEDASFCEECKCYVCSTCNCRIYHLDYQEELWAATEEKTEAKKNAKKSKNKKKKEKLKQRKAKQQQEDVPSEPDKKNHTEDEEEEPKSLPPKGARPSKNESAALIEDEDDSQDEDENNVSENQQIDFVLYLQQTGSILALAKLMDAMDVGEEEFDDNERKMIQQQQQMLLSSQVTH